MMFFFLSVWPSPVSPRATRPRSGVSLTSANVANGVTRHSAAFCGITHLLELTLSHNFTTQKIFSWLSQSDLQNARNESFNTTNDPCSWPLPHFWAFEPLPSSGLSSILLQISGHALKRLLSSATGSYRMACLPGADAWTIAVRDEMFRCSVQLFRLTATEFWHSRRNKCLHSCLSGVYKTLGCFHCPWDYPSL